MARKKRQPEEDDESARRAAEMAVREPVLAGQVIKEYTGFQDRLTLAVLVDELRKSADEIVAGDMSQIERMLATQSMMLNTLFCNLLGRADNCQTNTGFEMSLRLALKAQNQARTTAETLAILKNPQPYIRQANIAAGHQQVNNYAGAGKTETAQNKLLEVTHGERLDIGAAATAGNGHQDMETMGAVNRADN